MIIILANLLGLFLISFIVFQKSPQCFSKLLFWNALCFKLFAGLTVGYIYFYYYGDGDTINFYTTAQKFVSISIKDWFLEINEDTSRFDGITRVHLFSKILALILYISNGSYWIASLYFSFISFLAFWYASIVFSFIFSKQKTVIYICFLLVPSVVFWSSGILKESLTHAAAIFLVAVSVKVYKQRKVSIITYFPVILSLILLFTLKHYLFIVFVLFISMLWLVRVWKSKKNRFWFLGVLALIILIKLPSIVHPYLDWKRLPYTIYQNNKAIHHLSSTNAYTLFTLEAPTWFELIKKTPETLIPALYGPLVTDTLAPLGIGVQIENSSLFILSVLSILIIFFYKKSHNFIDKKLFIVLILISIPFLIILAWSSPNYGTLIRYKSVILPFLWWAVLTLPFRYFFTKNTK